MKHAHETYLERRLEIIELEIDEVQRQAIVSIAQIGELKRRRLHVVHELEILRDRRETSEIARAQLGVFR